MMEKQVPQTKSSEKSPQKLDNRLECLKCKEKIDAVNPKRYSLEEYCEKCQQSFKNKINLLIPYKSSDADLSKCIPELQEYLKNLVAGDKGSRKGLYLWGKFGVGKTWAEFAMIKKLIFILQDTANEGKYVDKIIVEKLSHIYEDLKEIEMTGYLKGYKHSPRDYKEKLNNVQVLMLDDIGLEKMSPFRQEILENIIDYRYANNKITFFTSNYPLEQLKNNIGGEIEGGRIISRIAGMCEVFEVGGIDRRTIK